MNDGDERLGREGLSLADLVRELASLDDHVPPIVEGDGHVRVTGVRHDSRRVEPGDLFVVRHGQTHDGARYIDDAIARGASAVMIGSGDRVPAHVAVPRLRVKDVAVGMAYAAAAVYGHPAFSLDVVGITGTNGKTTTTHLVRAAVDGASHRAVCGVVGTVGHSFAGKTIEASHTTPESDELARVLAEMRRRGATTVAMEVSSIALVLARVKAVRFRVAAFTNLTQDHLDFHGTMEAYAEAKKQLFTVVGPGMAVINVSDPFGKKLAEAARCQVLRVAVKPGSPEAGTADLAALAVTHAPNGMTLDVRVRGDELRLKTRLVGAHNVENILIALGVVSALDLDVGEAAAALAKESGPPGRLERCDSDGDDIVALVDYAHTPDALENVLSGLRPGEGGRVICVFGCGGDRDPTKRVPMGRAAGAHAAIAIATSDNPRTEDPLAILAAVEEGVRASGMPAALPGVLSSAARGYVIEPDRQRAIQLAVASARPGDIVVVCGKGHEDYQIVGTEKRPFDDRVETRAALAERRAKKTEV